MKTPHKHADLIKAWADGTEIELQSESGNWRLVATPAWIPAYEYRLKPTPKPTVVTWHSVYSSGSVSSDYPSKWDVQTTFCLRLEIDHNDPCNPLLVSAALVPT